MSKQVTRSYVASIRNHQQVRDDLGLHGWAFDRFVSMLEYKAAARGISVERGVYVCEDCAVVANVNVNGAGNIRQQVLPTLACDGGDRDIGWMAQPVVRVFENSTGRGRPQDQVRREP